VVTNVLPPASVRAYHVYFPDPWPKHRHAKRRVFTPRLIDAMARTLVPDGRLFIATDVHGYGWLIRGRILEHGAFNELPVDEMHGGLATAFARKYRARGRAVYLAAFRMRSP
jgi:tRNA (guanine-N7-)-methyltransferase